MQSIRTFFLFLALAFAPLVSLAASPIDVNTASAQALAALDGIGPQKAQAIVEYRQKHGPFKSVDELLNVKGIGEKTLAANRDKVTVSASTPKPASK